MKKLSIIGLWTLIAIGLLYAGSIYLRGLSVFSKSYEYYSVFQNIDQVRTAAPVFIKGYKVGNIKSMKFDFESNGHTVICFNIDKKVKIPQGTVAVIRQTMLNGVKIDLQVPNTPSTAYLSPGDTIMAKEGNGDVMDAVAKDVMPVVVSILPKLDSTVVGINKLLNNPDLVQMIGLAKNGVGELAQMSKKLNQSADLVQPLMEQLTTLAQNIDRLSQDFGKLTRSIEPKQLNRFVTNLEHSSEQLHRFSEQLNDKNNSLGKVLNDEGVYNRLDSVLRSTDALINDIKANPKRYISIKLF